jgi:23S rRNA (cytidine1920-2'-O)/16S rRNA (cytidine1409-2'-O)-methyltransferase
VTVDGRPVVKPSAVVADDALIELAAIDRYVSRAAHKLIAALDGFGIPVADRLALDVGASTGGFTQVLLERRAARVIALDVGHDQLDPLIRRDARVAVVEGFNARELTPASLAAVSGIQQRPDLVVGDLSFISLRTVLPALLDTAVPGADLVLLIKPQFEVGRSGIREGVVKDAALREDAVMGVLWAAWDLGLGTAGVLPSPVIGAAGNHEYLAHLHASAGVNPTEWSRRVSAMA